MILTQENLLAALKMVRLPGARSDIVEAGQISRLDLSENTVFIEIQMSELNPTFEKSLRFQIEKEIQRVDANAQIAVEFRKIGAVTEEAKAPVTEKKISSRVATMIAVGSGKGGVGKSSLSVNLAIAFQQLGYTVGILDCDVYGPSIPTMLKVVDQKPMLLNGKIQPIEAYGLKIMSAGFFVEEGQSIIWRGPMIHKLIQQFVNDVAWDGTDILIVDLPPGTGDAPLSLAQTMPLTGAVMVSMPQQVSIIDVHKGISMFNQVKVPILGVIENMSHFICPHCDHSSEIFDRGKVKKFCENLGVSYLGDVPIEPKLRELSDAGKPFMLDHQNSSAGKAITQIAKRLQPFVKTYDDLKSNGGEEIKLVL
ncbi:MAG: Mrp/NBP35 family ATP-binding protein [Deltaproteobacteria bacterium]|nr:Mrp/NBP35 family ATP-binding protein [Deltaproteobacteria bacterium]